MWHSKVTKTPCKSRNCRHCTKTLVSSYSFEHRITEFPACSTFCKTLNLNYCITKSTKWNNNYDSWNYKSNKNQTSLNKVCCTNSTITTKNCIRKNNYKTNKKSCIPAESEDRIKELCTSYKSRCCINSKEYNNKENWNYWKNVCFIIKTVWKEFWNCDWILISNWTFAERLCN